MSGIDINDEDIDRTTDNEGSSEDNEEDGEDKDIETPQLNSKFVQHFHTGMTIQNY